MLCFSLQTYLPKLGRLPAAQKVEAQVQSGCLASTTRMMVNQKGPPPCSVSVYTPMPYKCGPGSRTVGPKGNSDEASPKTAVLPSYGVCVWVVVEGVSSESFLPFFSFFTFSFFYVTFSSSSSEEILQERSRRIGGGDAIEFVNILDTIAATTGDRLQRIAHAGEINLMAILNRLGACLL